MDVGNDVTCPMLLDRAGECSNEKSSEKHVKRLTLTRSAIDLALCSLLLQ